MLMPTKYKRGQAIIFSHCQIALSFGRRSVGARLQSRSPARPCFSPDAGHPFDLGMKTLIADRLVLIERKPDIVDGFPVELGLRASRLARDTFAELP